MIMKIALSVRELHSLASVSIIVLQSDMGSSNVRYSFQEGYWGYCKVVSFFCSA